MLADKYIFEQWDCPDTVQAALRYPGVDVVYEGMMGLLDRRRRPRVPRTDATLKLNRSGFGVYHEGAPAKDNPVVKADSFRDGTIDHMQNFFDCIKNPQRVPTPQSKPEFAAARAGQIANLAYPRHRSDSLAAKNCLELLAEFALSAYFITVSVPSTRADGQPPKAGFQQTS